MTDHHARVLALAAVLIGISAVGLSTSLHAQRSLADLPLDEVRVLAEQGDAAAQTNLGGKYATGRGVSQDYVEAHIWSDLAAAQSSGGLRDQAVRNRDIFAEFLTADQIAEAQRRAREWKPTPEPVT